MKQRYSPLRGFGRFAAAARCCTGFEEQRQYFRAVARSGQLVSLGDRRRAFQERWATVMAALAAARPPPTTRSGRSGRPIPDTSTGRTS